LEAGDKQLLTFLSGEGGMGKSLLIRLLVQHWRSKGKRVLVCAASAKAARLIGGHTVHSAFKLRLNGGFYETQLDGTEKHTKQWAWLFTRDIIIIDEISMLTAGALHGVNHALNHVMSLSMSKESNVTFGEKSILAVGDLFQLPAVERFRFKEQAPLTH
jgi:predicted ATP-dependent serine protease